MDTSKPRVSIGLPVFNGENFLEEALDSILAQTYRDFELIISDNASTDRTEEICETYSGRDQRIRYYRNEKNLGASENFNRVFELSSGEYFKWAAHDDVLHPEYLSRCVTVLDQDPSIVLCHAKTGCIDEDSSLVGMYSDYDYLRISSPKPHERFFDLMLDLHWCYIVFGVVRAKALKLTSLLGKYPASDRTLLAQLGLIGRLYQIPECLFSRRDHSQTHWRVWGNDPKRVVWFDPTKSGRITFPHWRLCFEYFISIRKGALTLSERFLCLTQVVKLLFKHRWRNTLPMWRWLLVDLKRAAKQLWSG